jgi:Coenzyme A transferase
MDKLVASAAATIADIAPGMTLTVGGFGLCGIPSLLIGAERLGYRPTQMGSARYAHLVPGARRKTCGRGLAVRSADRC